jgi:hypothetical protein
LAACLYAGLTGRYPRDFPAGSDPFLIILKNRPVPIAKRASGLPAGLAEVIDRALDDEGELYFQTAASFKAALLEAAGGAAVS